MSNSTFSSFFNYKQEDYPHCIRVNCDYLTFNCSSEKIRFALYEIVLKRFEKLTQHKIRFGKVFPSVTESNPFCIFHEPEIYRLKNNFLSHQYKLSFPGKSNTCIFDMLFDFPDFQNFSQFNNVKIAKLDFKIETFHNINISPSVFLDEIIITQLDTFCIKQQLIEATFLHPRVVSRVVNTGGYHITLKNVTTPTTTKIYIRTGSETVSLEITIRGALLVNLTQLWFLKDFNSFIKRLVGIFLTRTSNLYSADFLKNSRIIIDSIISRPFLKNFSGLVFSSKNRYRRVFEEKTSASFLCHFSSDYYYLVFLLFYISDLIKNNTGTVNITFKIKSYSEFSGIKRTKRHTNEFKLFMKRLAFTTYSCNESSNYCCLITNLQLKNNTVNFVLNFNTFQSLTTCPASSSIKITKIDLLEIYTFYYSFFKKSNGNHPKYLLCLFLQAKYSTLNKACLSSFLPKSKKNREMLISTVRWLFSVYFNSPVSFEETKCILVLSL
jgi:hypothetical protein